MRVISHMAISTSAASLTIKSKGLQDMASEADMETEVLIKTRLAASWPQDAFLGEETGMTDFAEGQGIWVVDPIDGTQPFVSGMSSWCVSIAFMMHGACSSAWSMRRNATNVRRRLGAGDAERQAGRAASGQIHP